MGQILWGLPVLLSKAGETRVTSSTTVVALKVLDTFLVNWPGDGHSFVVGEEIPGSADAAPT